MEISIVWVWVGWEIDIKLENFNRNWFRRIANIKGSLQQYDVSLDDIISIKIEGKYIIVSIVKE